MELNKVKELQEKMTDYTQFAFILLTVSVFLYIGVLIPPSQGKEIFQVYLLMGTTVLFLSFSFYFFQKAIKCKRQLNDTEEQK